MARPYRAPRGTIMLGVVAAAVWGVSTLLGFQQYGMRTVLIGIAFACSGAALYAWRKMMDRRKLGLPMVALLTIAIGLILPGMTAHSAVEISKAADQLVQGTLTDFTRAVRAPAAGDLDAAKTDFTLSPVIVQSRDEVGDMAVNFNRLQEEIGRAASGLAGAREGLSAARGALTQTNRQLSESNARLTLGLGVRAAAEQALRESQGRLHDVQLALDEHALVVITDPDGFITYVNDKFCAFSQYHRQELTGGNHRLVHSGFHPRSFFAQLWQTISQGKVWKGEIKKRARDGSFFGWRPRLSPVWMKRAAPSNTFPSKLILQSAGRRRWNCPMPAMPPRRRTGASPNSWPT
jgi:PAS domain S-box-containing protein